jgi:hypothetical protein
MFTTGLGEPLRIDVELVTLPDLQTTMSLAQAYERCTAVAKTGMRPTTSTATRSLAASAASSAQVASTQRPCFCRLSLEELATKRANN